MLQDLYKMYPTFRQTFVDILYKNFNCHSSFNLVYKIHTKVCWNVRYILYTACICFVYTSCIHLAQFLYTKSMYTRFLCKFLIHFRRNYLYSRAWESWLCWCWQCICSYIFLKIMLDLDYIYFSWLSLIKEMIWTYFKIFWFLKIFSSFAYCIQAFCLSSLTGSLWKAIFPSLTSLWTIILSGYRLSLSQHPTMHLLCGMILTFLFLG